MPSRPASERPPEVGLPRVVQTARFMARPIQFFERHRRELGETFRVRLLFGPGEFVFVSDPGSLKLLFAADRVNTIAPGRNVVLGPLLGPESLLLQKDAGHLRARRLMLPSFHGERMRAYESTIREVSERALGGWPIGPTFRAMPRMQAITLEVILRAVFGVQDAGLRDALRDGLLAILAETASPAAIGATIAGLRRLPRYRRFARLVERSDALLAAEIAERRRDPDLAGREDILSLLVAARFEDGSQMSDAELRDQLMTLLLAGHETTATGLAWTFDLLIHHPTTLARLTAELADGDRTYLEAVITESLRLRPVVPMTGRLLHEPARLGGYELDPGTVVMAAIGLVHTRADLHEDPYAFRPERFLADGAPETYSWIPFGGGTRRCIGAAFARMEMRVAIETILRSVELRAADPELERPVRRNVTISPANGTRVIASPRADGRLTGG
ncbi:MAG: cytochrome P450 [Solirubrobacterales bacterium]|nr:cytochrome P450 [Solirubrobacterales bacterium]